MTLTCVSVTSGNASIGKDLNAAKPPATKRISPSTTNRGFVRANEKTRSIISCFRFLGSEAGARLQAPRGRFRPTWTARGSIRCAACELAIQAIEEQIPVDHHLLPKREAVDDTGYAVVNSVELDLGAGVAPRRLLDEHVVSAAGRENRLLRDLQVRLRMGLEVGGDEHLPFELALAVVERAADLDGSRRRVDEIGDRLDGRTEGFAGPCGRTQLDGLAATQRPELPLRSIELDPKAGGVGDHE